MASPPADVEELLSGVPALPLIQSNLRPDPRADQLLARHSNAVFPRARHPQAALAGLALRLGCWTESHQIAQDLSSREGSYWHAILHRMEPDPFNAGYWFQRVGRHPIFSELYRQAQTILTEYPGVCWTLKAEWDPTLFVDWCGEAERQGREAAACAEAIHNAEWALLFEWCAATE